jgi:hypothetical protein
MSRRTYAAAAVAMLASALWIEGTPASAASFAPCGRVVGKWICPPLHQPICQETKWVTKYVNNRKYYSTCCAKWRCSRPWPTLRDMPQRRPF